MGDRTREAAKELRPTTVLDPLRPAVVVRRRVYDATPSELAEEAPRAFSTSAPSTAAFVPDEQDESGPPSSINVARALASLRGEELQRLEELVRADDDDDEDEDELVEAPPSDVAPDEAEPEPQATSTPEAPTLRIGKTIALSELATRMGVWAEDLPAALVARGFYAIDANAVLSRPTARTIAELYGWRVEPGPEDLEEPPPPARSRARARVAPKRKLGAKAKKTKAKGRPAAPTKPVKRRVARRRART